MAKLKKESLVDQVYARLRGDIITLKLPLGSHVNVNELQDKLGVSCTPIREAVNRLQQEGLVLYKNNVGAEVLTLEAHDVQEIQELALALQKEAARLAMLRATGHRSSGNWRISWSVTARPRRPGRRYRPSTSSSVYFITTAVTAGWIRA